MSRPESITHHLFGIYAPLGSTRKADGRSVDLQSSGHGRETEDADAVSRVAASTATRIGLTPIG
ncbi:hypothetical protein [Mycobacterium arosiense]|uniref:hypothetical protein n=1 Tax=Mycobacterium arosiense TaxID=425468 RepID=UPI001301F843|nr:hypothetical protein [Mycobacterium arosiense]